MRTKSLDQHTIPEPISVHHHYIRYEKLERWEDDLAKPLVGCNRVTECTFTWMRLYLLCVRTW